MQQVLQINPQIMKIINERLWMAMIGSPIAEAGTESDWEEDDNNADEIGKDNAAADEREKDGGADDGVNVNDGADAAEEAAEDVVDPPSEKENAGATDEEVGTVDEAVVADDVAAITDEKDNETEAAEEAGEDGAAKETVDGAEIADENDNEGVAPEDRKDGPDNGAAEAEELIPKLGMALGAVVAADDAPVAAGIDDAAMPKPVKGEEKDVEGTADDVTTGVDFSAGVEEAAMLLNPNDDCKEDGVARENPEDEEENKGEDDSIDDAPTVDGILKGDALLVIEKGEEEEEDAADEEVRESEGKVGAEPPEETPSEEKVGAELPEETPNEGNDGAVEAKEVTPKEGNVPKDGALDGRAVVPKMEGAEEPDVTAAAEELETPNPKSDAAEPEPRLGALTLMDVANDDKEVDAGNSPEENDDVDVATEEPREKDDNPNPPLFADEEGPEAADDDTEGKEPPNGNPDEVAAEDNGDEKRDEEVPKEKGEGEDSWAEAEDAKREKDREGLEEEEEVEENGEGDEENMEEDAKGEEEDAEAKEKADEDEKGEEDDAPADEKLKREDDAMPLAYSRSIAGQFRVTH